MENWRSKPLPMVFEQQVYDFVKARWTGRKRLVMYYLVDAAVYFVLLLAMFTMLTVVGVKQVEFTVPGLLLCCVVFAAALSLMVGTFTWMVWLRKAEQAEREAAVSRESKKAAPRVRNLTHKTYH